MHIKEAEKKPNVDNAKLTKNIMADAPPILSLDSTFVNRMLRIVERKAKKFKPAAMGVIKMIFPSMDLAWLLSFQLLSLSDNWSGL